MFGYRETGKMRRDDDVIVLTLLVLTLAFRKPKDTGTSRSIRKNPHEAVRPKAAFMLGIVAEVLGLKPSDGAVQRAVLFTVLSCIAMMIAPKQIRTAVLPAASTDSARLQRTTCDS